MTSRRTAELAGTCVLLVCVGLYAWRSRNWPLVNDAALMHYVVFLMDRGLAPYRDIGDINFPGAYAPEWASMRLAALLHVSEAAMWRMMDWVAVGLAWGAMAAIAGRERWFAGVWAGSLFALAHGADGVGQAGQRDLWMVVLLLWGVAAVPAARRSPQRGWVATAALLIGAASTIKPFAVLWLVLLLILFRRHALVVAGAFLLPVLGAVGLVVHWGALPAFRQALATELPYHARLGDASLTRLIALLADRATLELLVVFAACLILGFRSGHSPDRPVLLAATGFGLFSFVGQGKGYPYQLYPFTAFLLLLMALEFAAAVRSPHKALAAAGCLGLALGVLVADRSWLRSVSRATWPAPVTYAMEAALRPYRDGEVQCLDSVSGCTDALLALHLQQATGNLYDEFLFPQTPSPWGVPYSGPPPGFPVPPAVLSVQRRFQAAMLAHPPRMFLVVTWLFPQGPGDYRKLALWPWFDTWLRARYRLSDEHRFPRAENGPMGFRVYIRQ